MHEVRAVEVPVRPLDSLDRSAWPGPYLLKLDCEGFEMEVLKGARATLAGCDMVVSEISVARRHVGGYSFADFIAMMDGLGFELFDIVDLQQYGPDGRLSFMDGVFVPKGSPFAAGAQKVGPTTG